jgi:hypothetical protein
MRLILFVLLAFTACVPPGTEPANVIGDPWGCYSMAPICPTGHAQCYCDAARLNCYWVCVN